ncbi:hypothetical protein ANN_11197 [Periplaneta americana]|uniref:DUF4817 domain-containing protein n=1 Tax=Periplaneta americana TaxID=6978 RepID=A0ABQ8T4B8_PERAM|nr:hypothetical protein ANN_11197 [Periplaneta americana]
MLDGSVRRILHYDLHFHPFKLQIVQKLNPTDPVFRNSPFGDINLPAWSPDLSAADFFLWGQLKGKMYLEIVNTIQELKDKIRTGIQCLSIMAEYTLEQRIFLYDAYVKYSSARRCRREFEHRFAGVRIPSRSTIHDLVNKVRRTGSFLNKKRVQQRRVLTEEKLDEVGARLEH